MTQKPLLDRILDMYGFAGAEIAPRQSGYRNHSYRVTRPHDQDVNFILYKREPGILARIRRANKVSDYLAHGGFPTRRTLGTGIIRLSAEGYTRYGALYTYLPGVTIPWEAYTRSHLKLLGSRMSDMHEALKGFPDAKGCLAESNAVQEYLAITRRMDHYFQDPGVQLSARGNLGLDIRTNICKRFETVLAICDNLDHQQALHLDFVRGNLLFDTTPSGLVISGILDFEKTAYGPPILDIARTLAFLLVDSKFKSEVHVRKFFLLSGYNKRGKASFRPIVIIAKGRRINLLDQLVDLFLVHDFYKFMRHNPYDSLRQNEHYVRTRDILLQRGLITRPLAPDRIAARATEPVL